MSKLLELGFEPSRAEYKDVVKCYKKELEPQHDLIIEFYESGSYRVFTQIIFFGEAPYEIDRELHDAIVEELGEL